MKWHYELICEDCGYQAFNIANANDHEDKNPDHWVQLIRVEIDDRYRT